MENIIEKEIKAGNNLVIINFKNDPQSFFEVKKLAEKANRQDDLILISPFMPEQSSSINPFDPFFTPEEMARNICGGMCICEDFNNPWIYNYNLLLCETVIRAFLLLAKVKEKPINLSIKTVESYLYLKNIKELKFKIDFMSMSPLFQSKADLYPEADKIIENFTKILSLHDDIYFFSYYTSCLRNIFKVLKSENMRKIINSSERNIFLERLEFNKRIILVVQINCLFSRKTFYFLGTMILSMLHSYIERKYLSGIYLAPLSIYTDEVEHYSKYNSGYKLKVLNYCELNKFINLSQKAGIQLYGFPEPTIEEGNNSVVSEKKSRRGRKSRIITKTMS